MVIKRNWKTASGQGADVTVPLVSSSEDSNSSMQTISSSAASIPQRSNNASGRVAATNPNDNMAAKVLIALKNRYNGRSSRHQSDLEIACHSLELMRINLQDSFNKEVDVVVKKYIQTYFRPAMTNIKENLIKSVLNDDYFLKISRTLLDNAIWQYGIPRENTNTIVEHAEQYNRAIQNASIKKPKKCAPEQKSVTVLNVPCKRKEISSSEDEINCNASPTHHVAKKANTICKSILRSKLTAPRNVKLITHETLFVLDLKANLALGYTKGHVSNDHPELLRYQIDDSDKEWLVHKRILSPTYKARQVSLMLLDDIHCIAKDDVYQKRDNLKLNDLIGFKLADYMLPKMRAYFQNLHKTNTTISIATITTSKLASLSTVAAATTATSMEMATAVATATVATTIPMLTRDLPTVIKTTSSTNVPIVHTITNGIEIKCKHGQLQMVPTSSINKNSNPILKKSLSSTHATLSALLSSSSESTTNTPNSSITKKD